MNGLLVSFPTLHQKTGVVDGVQSGSQVTPVLEEMRDAKIWEKVEADGINGT